MSPITGIDPKTVRLADLDVLESSPTTITIAPAPPRVTRRDARHEILGAIKIIARMSGMSMIEDVHPTELLVRRIDQLEAEAAEREAQIVAMKESFELEKSHYRNQIADCKKALRNISVVLDGHVDPFEVKPYKKWNKEDLGAWIMAVVGSMNWARQRADNLLDPVNAQPIAPDPEV